jgi:ABC-type bacteriocin/lantibiotic exporter with double-glycine peptidase domain
MYRATFIVFIVLLFLLFLFLYCFIVYIIYIVFIVYIIIIVLFFIVFIVKRISELLYNRVKTKGNPENFLKSLLPLSSVRLVSFLFNNLQHFLGSGQRLLYE